MTSSLSTDGASGRRALNPSANHSRRDGSRAARIAAAVITGIWVLRELAVMAGVVPGRPLPLVWLAVPLALVGLRNRRPSSALLRLCELARRCPAWLLVAGLAVLVLGLWLWGQVKDPYLGHDEAVYGTKARDFAGVGPASQWNIYRPPLLPALGAPIVRVGGDVVSLRLLSLVLAGAALCVLAWVAGGRKHPFRAAVTVLLFVSGIAFQRRIPEFMNDLPTAGLTLASVELLVRSRRPGQARLLTVVAVLAVIAFYLRYGATSAFVSLVIGAVCAWGVRAWARPVRPLLAASAIMTAGLLPHLLWSWVTVGSPLGALTAAADIAGRSYIGDGLLEYAWAFPVLYVGDVGGVVMAIGLLAGGLAWRRVFLGVATDQDRRAVLFTTTAVTHIVVLGLTAHPEDRFVFLPIMLLLAVGVEALSAWCSPWAQPAVLAVASAALIALPATAVRVAEAGFASMTAERTSIAEGASQVPASQDCLVVTGYRPQMGWATGCSTSKSLSSVPKALDDGLTVAIVRYQRGRYQEPRAQLDRLLEGHQVERRTLPWRGSLGAGEVFILQP